MMCKDIELLSDVVDGFVIGCLDLDGNVDASACRRLMAANAKGLPVTFHRAFDMAKDPMAAMEAIAELGCARLLTSGQQATAFAGRCVPGEIAHFPYIHVF